MLIDNVGSYRKNGDIDKYLYQKNAKMIEVGERYALFQNNILQIGL